MLGWDSAATAFASRSNRASTPGSAATDSGSTLIATSRSSFLSRARYTSPIPPAPMGERISDGARRVPGESVISPRNSSLQRWVLRSVEAARRLRIGRGIAAYDLGRNGGDMTTRRELLFGALISFSTAVARARSRTASALEVTYYYLPG